MKRTFAYNNLYLFKRFLKDYSIYLCNITTEIINQFNLDFSSDVLHPYKTKKSSKYKPAPAINA